MASKASIKWLGHATFQVTSPGGRVIIVDPWIAGNPACPIKLDDIKVADLVLVSHDHSDHAANAVDIVRQTSAMLIAMPETCARFKAELGLPEDRVILSGIGMNIGGSVQVAGITVTMVQAYHSSGTGCPSGFVVKLENGTTIYHAGDTGIFSSMKLLAEIYRIDIALLPIGSCSRQR